MANLVKENLLLRFRLIQMERRLMLLESSPKEWAEITNHRKRTSIHAKTEQVIVCHILCELRSFHEIILTRKNVEQTEIYRS